MQLLLLYLNLISCSILGLAFQLWAKSKSMSDKAAAAEVDYIGLTRFVKQEQMRIFGTLASITLLFLIIGPAIDPEVLEIPNEKVTFFWGFFAISKVHMYRMVLSVFFATVGYGGTEVALRFFSRTNNELNKAINLQTKDKQQNP
jgi:hypothetical protein